MGPFLAAFTLVTTPLLASNILFLTSQGRHEEAAQSLRSEKIDETLVEEMALSILRQGVQSRDPEEAILALFGASVALNEKAEVLFESAYQSPLPQVQIAALSMIAKSKSDSSNYILNQAIGAPHPIIRLEAAFLLAQRKAPQASIRIESLMHKIDPIAHFLFPKLFALIGDDNAKKNLKRLLSHPQQNVRTEAILAIGSSHRDDLTREIKRSLTHPDPISKEAAATAVALLKDETSIKDLEKLTKAPSPAVRIAAMRSLAVLTKMDRSEDLEKLAMEGNLFAIQALSLCSDSKETLVKLLDHPDRSVRANATLALLPHKDKRVLRGLPDLLIKDARDLCLTPVLSPAGSLTAYKVVSSAKQNLEDTQASFEISLQLREEALQHTLELDDESFYKTARLVLNQQQNDLVPILMTLLENKGTTSVDFLKEEEQRAGAPFIRAWAALSLYKMKEEGPYEKKLKDWLKQEASLDLVKFRPFIPWEMRQGNPFELTPNEKASLYVSIIEAFIMQDPDMAIDLLLDMIGSGAGKNRFVLAGLLLRTIQ